ncbi:MAG: pyridoxine 5'-phosphate synthase [Flavobacteriales bacterium]|nr:pyridoxine 5'-phosphate synthase [Flavobacteriales bacterium]
MTRLSVNINKLATLRNARGGNDPDVVAWALEIEQMGAHGITVHPRPDERHIRRSDVFALKEVLTTEFNIEGYPSEDLIAMVLAVKPAQVTLVPDPPGVLTSNAGWDAKQHRTFLQPIIQRFKGVGIRTSLFMGTDPEQLEHAASTGTDRIELYTGPYADHYRADRMAAVAPFAAAAKAALGLGLGLNAGHDLNLRNLAFFNTSVTGLQEVSIGHALVCDALRYGMENTVRMYLRELALSPEEVATRHTA